MEDRSRFWKDKRVFVTGHTGFKGSWLILWLHSLGAKVTGFSLPSPTQPSLYEICNLNQILVHSDVGDIQNLAQLSSALVASAPEIVFHLAAQPLVRDSYKFPVKTYMTNVMGTVHLLEAVRSCPSVKAVVNVTTDKCYENHEWEWGYRESDAMGGRDPYSNSKACSELVTNAYRLSFFHPQVANLNQKVGIATVRAGNVIGGGDWAKDRLIPDCIRSILENKVIKIRNPQSIRPWQHVLEPLSGYLNVAEKLFLYGYEFSEAYNFGPFETDVQPVSWIVHKLCEGLHYRPGYEIESDGSSLHEAHHLKLDISRAKSKLEWQPKWNLSEALEKVIEWTVAFQQGKDLQEVCLKQIESYEH